MSNRSGTVKNVECTNYTYITNYITPSPYYEQFNRSGTVKNVEYNNKIRRLYREFLRGIKRRRRDSSILELIRSEGRKVHNRSFERPLIVEGGGRS